MSASVFVCMSAVCECVCVCVCVCVCICTWFVGGFWNMFAGKKKDEVWEWRGLTNWCCFYYFIRNSLAAFLEALFASAWIFLDVRWKTRNDVGSYVWQNLSVWHRQRIEKSPLVERTLSWNTTFSIGSLVFNGSLKTLWCHRADVTWKKCDDFKIGRWLFHLSRTIYASMKRNGFMCVTWLRLGGIKKQKRERRMGVSMPWGGGFPKKLTGKTLNAISCANCNIALDLSNCICCIRFKLL